MNINKKRPLSWALLLCLSFANTARSDFFIQANQGVSHNSSSDYKSDLSAKVGGGYIVNDWAFAVGFVYLGNFGLDDNSNFNNHVESSGQFFELSKGINVGVVDLNFGLGISNINSRAKFADRLVGEHEEIVPFVEFAASKAVAPRLDIRSGLSWFSDVSGSDISIFGLGVRYEF